MQEGERWERIVKSRYNKWYGGGGVKSREVPAYLKKGWRKSRWRSVARYKLGNEMRVERY